MGGVCAGEKEDDDIVTIVDPTAGFTKEGEEKMKYFTAKL